MRTSVIALLVAIGAVLLVSCARQDAADGDEPPTGGVVADPGPDREVVVGTTVTLDASGSSGPDPDQLAFEWHLAVAPAGSVATLDDTASVVATFVPDLVGVYVVDVTVSDASDVDSASVAVVAQPLPDVPSVEAIDDQVARPGSVIEVPFNVQADGPDIQVDATSSDQLLLPDAAIDAAGEPGQRRLHLAPASDGDGEARVTVIVRDALGRGSSVEFTLRVAMVFPLAERLPDDQAPPEHPHGFGASVAISGPRALVGVPGSDRGGPDSGLVHAYVHTEGGWEEVGLLEPTEPPIVTHSVSDARFGTAVAISGNHVVVGAPGGASGHAYFFTRCNPFITMCPRPYVESGVVSGDAAGTVDRFGASVAIDGSVAVVGAPHEATNGIDHGAVYVYERGTDGWARAQKLEPPGGDTVPWEFGRAVAVAGERILVGEGYWLGMVTLYERIGGAWTAIGSRGPFGEFRAITTVAMDGSHFAVGAGRSTSELERPTVFLYSVDETGSIVQRGVIHAEDWETPIGMGPGLALAGTALLIGFPWQQVDALQLRGSVDVYADTDGAWTFVHSIDPGELPVHALFGHSLAIDGGRAIVGAPGVADQGSFGGAAFGLGE